ncbi:hypothetical protein ACFQXA_01880 [Nocardiopsis composta]
MTADRSMGAPGSRSTASMFCSTWSRAASKCCCSSSKVALANTPSFASSGSGCGLR